jgi:hypothetical protein
MAAAGWQCMVPQIKATRMMAAALVEAMAVVDL